MHRSRLCQLVIDCNEETMDTAAAFWGAALGMSRDPADDPKERYGRLIGRPAFSGIAPTLLQRVEGESGFHIDIETDDVEAEVRRLEALGATRKRQVRTWWVMRAPTGHDFCVVRPQSADFPGDANVWDD